MRRCLACLLVCLLWAGATAIESAAQAKGKVVLTGGFVYDSEVIPPGATVQFKVTCPPPNNAISGALTSGDRRVLSLSSVPAGGGKAWSFGFRNTDATKPVTIVVVVSCAAPPPVFGLK